MMDLGLLSSCHQEMAHSFVTREWEQFGLSQLKMVKKSRGDNRSILKMNEKGIC